MRRSVTTVRWYRKAAEQGHANAQINLAESTGNNAAEEKLNLIAAEMTPSRVKKAQRLVRKWAPNVS